MLELFIIAAEKLMDNPVVLAGVIIGVILCYVGLLYRTEHVAGKFYVEKDLSELVRKHMHGFIGMLFVLISLTELLVQTSLYLYGYEKKYSTSFLLYYLPMFLYLIYKRLIDVKKERRESYLKCGVYILPGVLFHVLFLAFIVNYDKNVWVLGGIAFLGAMLPSISSLIILSVSALKDTKMIRIELSNNIQYDVMFKDFIEKKGNAHIRIRDKYGRVDMIMVYKAEDIVKKTIYIKRPNVDFNKYNATRV